MLLTIFLVLFVLWALGIFRSGALEDTIHKVLLTALAILLIRTLRTHRPIAKINR